MMQKKLLDKYNAQLLTTSHHPYYFPGVFNNNHILFVGICPNEAEDGSQFKADMDAVQQDQTKYQEKLEATPMGQYISSIAGNFTAISFTNLIKQATKEYAVLPEEEIAAYLEILNKQIDLLNPNMIIVMGKFVGAKFGLNNYFEIVERQNLAFMMIPHHSYVMRSGQLQQTVTKTQLVFNEWARLKCIVNVTSKNIFYRDVAFSKKSYNNSVIADYCFVKTDATTEYKSFRGENLKKVPKFTADKAASFEAHLTAKDIFYYENFKNVKHSKLVKVMHFDIETDFCNDVQHTPKPIISIAWHDNITNGFYCIALKHSPDQNVKAQKPNVKVKLFDNEREMLEFFIRTTIKYDVMAGWYSSGFDIPYIVNRAKLLGIQLDKYYDRMFMTKTADGKLIIQQDSVCFYDAQEFYKRNSYYSKPKSYSLQHVAQYIFGEDTKKLEHDGTDILWRQDFDKLIEYNIHDVLLLKMISDEVNIIAYPLRLQQFCPQDFINIFYNSKTIENMLHQRYWNKKIYFPTKIKHTKVEFEGALVFEPEHGLHKNVMVLDFASMYTLIYLSHNYSPDTLIGEKNDVENRYDWHKQDLLLRHPELAKKFECFTTKEQVLSDWILAQNDFGEFYFLPQDWKLGILPMLESEALALREFYKKLRDNEQYGSMLYQIYDEQQGLAKQILNSIYGVVGYEKFILYDAKIPATITDTARKLLRWVKAKSLEKNYTPIYGDTDSIFVRLDEKLDDETAMQQAIQFEHDINLTWAEFISQQTSNQATINNVKHKVAFEKMFAKMRITSKKKRYFGKVSFYKGKLVKDHKLIVTGFETRRDDTPQFFKSALMRAYELLLEDNAKAALNEYKKQLEADIQKTNIEDLIIKIKLSRDADSYKHKPIHLRALENAKIAIRRGEHVNMIYVKDSRDVLHYDPQHSQTFELDYKKYIDALFIAKIALIDENIFNCQRTLLNWEQ